MIAQTSWAERKFDFDFPIGMFPIIVERLRGTPSRLEVMLTNVSREKLNHKLDDKWSIIEQLNHLCNSEQVWYGRIEDFLSGRDTFEARVLRTEPISDGVQTLLQNFAAAREKLITLVEHLDEAPVSSTIIHPRLQKRIRLIDSLFTTAEHDDHHLAKIRELLAAS